MSRRRRAPDSERRILLDRLAASAAPRHASNESLQLTGALAPLPLTLLPNDHGVSIDASIRTTGGPQVQRRV